MKNEREREKIEREKRAIFLNKWYFKFQCRSTEKEKMWKWYIRSTETSSTCWPVQNQWRDWTYKATERESVTGN